MAVLKSVVQVVLRMFVMNEDSLKRQDNVIVHAVTVHTIAQSAVSQ